MVATSVFPSPVSSSAMQRLWIAMPPDDLHVELPLADRPLGGLANQGKRFHQQAAQRITLPGSQLQLVSLGL